MTQELTNRTKQALTETENAIAKEMNYPSDLRRVDWLNKMELHKEKLIKMLSNENK